MTRREGAPPKVGDKVRITAGAPMATLDPDDEYAYHRDYALNPGEEAEYAGEHPRMEGWHMLLARFGETTVEVPARRHHFEVIG